MSWKEERTQMLSDVPATNTTLKKKQALLNRLKNMRCENVQRLRSDLKAVDMSKFTPEIVQILDKMHIKSDADVKNVVRLSIRELVCKVEIGVQCSWRFVLLYELKTLYVMKDAHARWRTNDVHSVSEMLTSAFVKLPMLEKLGALAYFVRNDEIVNPQWISEIKAEKVDDAALEIYNEVARALKIEERGQNPLFVKVISEEENEFLFYVIPFPAASLKNCTSLEIECKVAVEACKRSFDVSGARRLACQCDLIVLSRTPVDLNSLSLPCAARITFYSKRKVPANYRLRAELSKFAMDLALIDQNHLAESIEIAGRYHLAQRSTNKRMRDMIDKLTTQRVDADAIARMKIDSTLATVMRRKKKSVDFKRAFISIFHANPTCRENSWCAKCGADTNPECDARGCNSRLLVLEHLKTNKQLLILVFLKTWLFRDAPSEREWIVHFGLRDEICNIALGHVLATKDIALTHLLSALAGDKHDFFFGKLRDLGANVLLAYLEHLVPAKKAAYARKIDDSPAVKNFCWRNGIGAGKAKNAG